jgi:hypothetical protein
MSFTRYAYDDCRVEKQLQESTDPGRYMLNVPGNGDRPCFMEDPYIRMQKWGANLTTNTINLESDLKGLSRPLNRDCLRENNYKNSEAKTNTINYPICPPITEQPRAVMPAWTARDLNQNNFDYPLLNPQENVCFPFHNNLSTRILEKDYYLIRECMPQTDFAERK